MKRWILGLIPLTVAICTGACGGSKGDGGVPDGAPQLDGAPQFDGSQGGDARTADAAPPTPVLINFDKLSPGTDVTDQFMPFVTFSTNDVDQVNRAIDPGTDLSQSPPNLLCTAGAGGGPVNCASDTILDFPVGVSNLTFRALGNNDGGTVATINVFTGGSTGSPVGTIDVTGPGQNMPVDVDISEFANVTRIEITNVMDSSGIGWDDIAFDVPSP